MKNIPSKIFLDTNIVLDLLDTKRDGSRFAGRLIDFVVKYNIKVVISEDMLSTIYYIAKDKTKILNFFETVRQKWIISSFGDEVIREAIALSKSGADFEDALQCLCAKQNGCDLILTNDKEFIECGVKRISAEELLPIDTGVPPLS